MQISDAPKLLLRSVRRAGVIISEPLMLPARGRLSVSLTPLPDGGFEPDQLRKMVCEGVEGCGDLMAATPALEASGMKLPSGLAEKNCDSEPEPDDVVLLGSLP